MVWNRHDLDQPHRAPGHAVPCRHALARAGDAWRAAFTSAAPFELAAEHRIANVQAFDADGLVDRVLSVSFIAALPDNERRSIDASVPGPAAGPPLELRYVTELGVYVRRG